jgi:hypothetical protein
MLKCKFIPFFTSKLHYLFLTLSFSKTLSMPELDDNEIDEAFSEDAEQILHVLSMCGNAVAPSLPPVNTNEPDQCCRPIKH